MKPIRSLREWLVYLLFGITIGLLANLSWQYYSTSRDLDRLLVKAQLNEVLLQDLERQANLRRIE